MRLPIHRKRPSVQVVHTRPHGRAEGNEPSEHARISIWVGCVVRKLGAVFAPFEGVGDAIVTAPLWARLGVVQYATSLRDAE